ncbi:MAG: alpha/beta fold hydrolase [Acidaminococcaceae bacterium]|nr:alpha/beta fold hydrolase [Acidaminococcaceae bacterium]
MMFRLNVPTKRGVVLNGVLFRPETQKAADTVMIAITGIHGNFYSNPFYYNIGDTLNRANIDFVYAQTNDAFGEIKTLNVRTGKEETIGSWNERFAYTDEDIEAYLDFAEAEGYRHIILAGHSLGANKVIYYLSRHHDKRIERFFLLSPANLSYMMSGVTERQKQMIREQVERGDGDRMLPFPFMGWVECIANTAYDWQFSGLLNNVHTETDGDFSQAERITHTGALLVGTYDNFTDGDPSEFLRNLNRHMPAAAQNDLIFIEKTGHTYQMKQQEAADKILKQLQKWRQ